MELTSAEKFQALIHPKNIVIVGASSDISKPGGRSALNIVNGADRRRDEQTDKSAGADPEHVEKKPTQTEHVEKEPPEEGADNPDDEITHEPEPAPFH